MIISFDLKFKYKFRKLKTDYRELKKMVQFHSMKRIIFTFATLILISIFLPVKIQALELLSLESANIDTTHIRDETDAYTLPEQILVVPFFFPSIENSDEEIDSNSMLRGLYYYTMQKLGFGDIPFHYVVTHTGEVFEGNKGKDERKIRLKDDETNYLIVAYIAPERLDKFDPRSETNLRDLLLQLCNKNAINPEKISVASLQFNRNSEQRQVSMVKNEIFGSWNSKLDEFKNVIIGQYAPQKRVYSLSIENINIDTSKLAPGETSSGSITIKNTGETKIFGGSISEILATKIDGGNSLFFLNNNWVSRSQFSILPDGEILLPGEQSTYTFNFKIPLAYGIVAEDFTFRNALGDQINVNTFPISLDIPRGNVRIIEVPVGSWFDYLPVRNEPSTVAAEFSRVAPGERLKVLEDAGNGFIKVELNNGQSGWIAGWLVNNL